MAAIFLEKQICYDWDDYYVWADVYFDTDTNTIKVAYYGHGTPCQVNGVDHKDTNGEYDEAILKAFAAKYSVKGLGYSFISRLEDDTFLGIPYKDGIIATKKTVFRNGKIVNKSIDKAFDEVSEKALKEASHSLILGGGFSIAWLAHIIAYNISYSACDSDNAQGCYDKICFKSIQTFEKPDGYDEALAAYNAHKAEINAKRPRPAEDKKRKELEEWAARKLADKSEEYRQMCIERALARWRNERKMMYARRW